MKRYALLLCLLLPIGCATATAPTPPTAPTAPLAGSVNQFDADSYKTLMVIQASYNSLLSSYKANPTGLTNLKAPLDQIAQDYNLAESAWQAYHATAVATTPPSPAVTAALNKVQSDISKVTP